MGNYQQCNVEIRNYEFVAMFIAGVLIVEFIISYNGLLNSSGLKVH